MTDNAFYFVELPNCTYSLDKSKTYVGHKLLGGSKICADISMKHCNKFVTLIILHGDVWSQTTRTMSITLTLKI